MNFTPFGGHLAGSGLPTIHQFAAKLGYEAGGGAPEGGVQFAVAPGGSLTLDGVKFRQADSLVVVSAAQPALASLGHIAHTDEASVVNTGIKYQTISSTSSMNLGNIAYAGQTSYLHETVHHVKGETDDKRDEIHQELITTMMQQQVVTQGTPLQQGQQLLVVLHEPKEAAALSRSIKQEGRLERAAATAPAEFISIGDVTDSSTWQALGGGVAEYLSALPLPLHHLLKYAPADKRDDTHTVVTAVNANVIPVTTVNTLPANSVVVETATIVDQDENSNDESMIINNSPSKKKRKRKSSRDKKPRPKPGEIRLTTALDGSTLYCCPECHMVYPERGLLEQHLLGHTMERRFICDICNAALKRKDHLTRHKQSHNPERPHVCSVCMKAFKRKEQLTLHFVIHSGVKRHVCNECGKGFYRKDHLRKHTRSHIARRVKAELSGSGADSPARPVPLPAASAAAD